MWTVCALLALLPAVFAVDCAVQPDGVYDKGCRAFVTCTNHVAKVTECGGNEVYDKTRGICADPNSLSSNDLCAQSIDCSVKADGKYPDEKNACKTYYTCQGGVFFGHNYCPGGKCPVSAWGYSTVFNQGKQACDWASAFAPPCGTKTAT